MAILRTFAAAVALATASAQLVHDVPIAPQQLKQLVRDMGYTADKAPSGVVTPSICDSKVKQFSGYLDVEDNEKYFFWMFESRSEPSKDPLVLWLTGGPGCSSQLALLVENGPCSISKNGTTLNNPYSWTEKANVIWVDQPTATGFSVGPPTTHDEEGVARNMLTFMRAFYKELPQYKENDFFVFGESYAGHYVPAVSHYMWQQGSNGGFKVPLKGVGIGNGLTQPSEQYKWYPEMAFDGGKQEGGSLEKGVIDSTTRAAMQAATGPCVKKIEKCNDGDEDACMEAYSSCNAAELSPYERTGMNPYDMRIKCEVPGLCYDFSQVEAFLNDKETQKQLGVNKPWKSCNQIVNMGFQTDWMKNYQTKLPDMLADGIPVLIYAGDVDFICNWLGNKKWALKMDWPHKEEFNSAEDVDYMVDGKSAGKLRKAAGFHFLQVFQAGHMVPMDQPAVALQMLNDFTGGKLGNHDFATMVV